MHMKKCCFYAESAARLERTLREPQSDKLEYIPEEHNYRKFKNQILDFTKKTPPKMILSMTFWKKQKSNLIKSTNSKLNSIKII